MTAIARIPHASKGVVIGFHCSDLGMHQGGCGVLDGRCTGMHCISDHNGFASFLIGLPFNLALANLVYCCSENRDWSSVGGVHCWFPYGFANGLVYTLVKAAVLS